MKPILFNTEMVKMILNGRKTVTRRVVKPQPCSDFRLSDNCCINKGLHTFCTLCQIGKQPPYQFGDILYVRETWGTYTPDPDKCYPTLHFKASEVDPPKGMKWHPSIHMPREAARIFLKVTDVRVERLRDISLYDVWDEGTPQMPENNDIDGAVGHEDFAYYWDSVIKPKDRNQYGWDADPWVWVIRFEQACIGSGN